MAATLNPKSENGLPLVSCLMVTHRRLRMAQSSIRCFLNQTYEHRELIILEEEESDLRSYVESLEDARIIHKRVAPHAYCLGELRNIAVAEASGEYVCQWDDDDLFDPMRLEAQMSALMAQGADACFLLRWVVWWPRLGRFAISSRRLWEGSILCRTSMLPAYPPLSRGEDTLMLAKLLRSSAITVVDNPHLYIYIIHGHNTWDPIHFERFWSGATEQIEGPSYDRLFQMLRGRIPIAEYPLEHLPA